MLDSNRRKDSVLQPSHQLNAESDEMKFSESKPNNGENP